MPSTPSLRPPGLSHEALDLAADIGQTLIVYTAEPDWPSLEALNRLAGGSARPTGVSVDNATSTDNPR